ncbi:MAG: MarR family transcriptional regulator [Leptospira sp.]|jgi:MarR family transcriptional regulator, organic hydroperoxide resistance regulator|nr:MarR family transcriptional regulator [Leptospira sp.]
MKDKRMEELKILGLDNMLGIMISRTSYLLRKNLLAELNEKSLNFATAGEELALLTRVFEKPGIPQSELSNLTIKNKSTVSRLLNSLEKKNLILRVQDKKDKRVFNIHLSNKGEIVVVRFLTILISKMDLITNGISKKDLNTTISSLKIIYQNVLNIE